MSNENSQKIPPEQPQAPQNPNKSNDIFKDNGTSRLNQPPVPPKNK